MDEHVGRGEVELARDVAGVYADDADRLAAQPLAAELERVHLGRLGQRRQEGAQRLQVHLDARPQEPVGAQFPLDRGDVRLVLVHEPQQAAQERRQPVRQPVHRAEVEHAQPAVVEQPEVARMRVRVQQPGPRRAGEQEPGEQDARPVALFLAAVADDPGQRGAVHPLGEQHLAGGHHDLGHVDVRVAGVRGRKRALRAGLQGVVELLRDPVPQLVEQRLDIQPRHQQAEQPPGPAELGEVADQRASGTGVLDLHRDRPAVVPDRPVDLPDGRRGRGDVVEGNKAVPPGVAQLPGQDLVHGPGGQRGRGLLQPGQRGPVRPGELRRQRRLEDRQRLAQLHGAALELTQDPEDLVGGAPLDLLGHELGGPAADPFPDPQCRPARQADRQPGQLGGPGHRVARHIVHVEHCPARRAARRTSARRGPPRSPPSCASLTPVICNTR